MVTFLIGLLILGLGYIFYSRYVDKVFAPDASVECAIIIYKRIKSLDNPINSINVKIIMKELYHQINLSEFDTQIDDNDYIYTNLDINQYINFIRIFIRLIIN